MNNDQDYNSCKVPEDPDTHTNQYVDGNFVVGTVKWIKLANFPKWPGFIGKKQICSNEKSCFEVFY